MSSQPYVRPISKTRWFLDMQHPRYKRYMAREVTCAFIFAYCFLLVSALGKLAQGRDAFDAFVQSLGSPLGVLFSFVVLLFTIYHSISWFEVTPQAMPIQRGEEFVPGKVIVGAHYALWTIASLIILFWGI